VHPPDIDSNHNLTAGRWLGSRLKRILAAAARRRHPAFTGPDSAARLERVTADLEELNRRTEQGFLSIGGRLVDFAALARQLSADLAAVSELFFGKEGGHASQVLASVLEQSRQVEACAVDSGRRLAEVCESARRIGRTFRAFRDTISVFRVLGSLTRIETARLGNAGGEFGNLAEEVGALTRGIELGGESILELSSSLQSEMQSALGKIAHLRASELGDLPSLIAGVMANLESLEDRQRRAGEASLRQAAGYEGVSAAIADLITAIQFHDITRQQIEHVADALRRLEGQFREGRNARQGVPPDTRAVLALQISQLRNAEQIFAASAGRIERDLMGIADRVRGMTDAGATLLDAPADGRDSIFLQTEGRFTGILEVAGRCAQAQAETQSVLAKLREATGRMRDAVTEIRGIEIRIRRIAINATIRAVQIGAAGSALSVVADVMQRVAADSSSITGEVAGDLEAIGWAADSLSSGSGSMEAGQNSSQGGVLAEMRAAILDLHSSTERSFSRFHQIAALSSRLSADIHSVQGAFSAGALFSETIQRARRALEEVGRQAGFANLADAAGAGRLEDFEKHYTMQTERDVHDSVATGDPAGRPAPASPRAATASEEDLGENVELF
jgi:hypothetical protein